MILGFLKLYRLPQGGSITLEAVPILFLALRNGPRAGVAAGMLAGVLKLLLDSFIVHPVQLLLDYPVAFASLGLAGIFPATPRASILLAGACRWSSHFLSGVLFFESYAPEGIQVSNYAALYNLSYVGPETLLGILLVPTLIRRVPNPT